MKKTEYFWMTDLQIVDVQRLTGRLQICTHHQWPGWRRELLSDGVALYKILQACIHDEPEPIYDGVGGGSPDSSGMYRG